MTNHTTSNKYIDPLGHLYLGDSNKLSISDKKIITIEEAILDYKNKKLSKSIQKKYFREQLQSVKNMNLPVIISFRDSYKDCCAIIKNVYKNNKIKGAIYISSINSLQLKFFKNLGMFFIITDDDINKKNNIISKIPQNKLLIAKKPSSLIKNKKQLSPKTFKRIIKDISLIRKKTSAKDIERINNYNIISFLRLPFRFEDTYVYQIRNSLYINMTNRCTNNCTFCPRLKEPVVKGYYLRLKKEPLSQEIIDEIKKRRNLKRFDEIVFCGYGEPTMRWKEVKKIAKWLKDKGCKVRINTNGHLNMIEKCNVVNEVEGLFDTISVSLNFHSDKLYNKYCNPIFGKKTYDQLLNFIKKAKEICPHVIVSVIEGHQDVDIKKSESIARKLGVKLRRRSYFK